MSPLTSPVFFLFTVHGEDKENAHPAAAEKRATFIVDSRRESRENVSGEDSEVIAAVSSGLLASSSSAAAAAAHPSATSLLRNMVCSPVVEEDWATLSQESMNHIINDFTGSEKCEVDATSGSLKVNRS
jgi:hypothetical protein